MLCMENLKMFGKTEREIKGLDSKLHIVSKDIGMECRNKMCCMVII